MRKHMLSLSLILLLFQLNAQADWTFKYEKMGVKVFTRKDETSGITELKLQTKAKASLHSVVALSLDFEKLPEWSYRAKEAYVVKKVSETDVFFYLLTQFPSPFSDRDVVSHRVTRQDPVSKQVISMVEAVPEMLPEKEGIVRIKTLKARWLFTPLDDGMVAIEYQNHSDPGGNIPQFLINMAAENGPVKSMLNFVNMLPKYKDARVAFLKD
jgi:hypothetical protein